MNRSAINTILLFAAIPLVFGSCKKDFEGTELGNIAPETYLVTDTIIRFGDDRLESEVTLKWWSDDEDGFVTGYEYTFDRWRWVHWLTYRS